MEAIHPPEPLPARATDGRAIPLLWKTLEHPSASVSAEVVIALLQRAEHLLVGVGAITVLADRAFPTADLLRWLEVRRHHGR